MKPTAMVSVLSLLVCAGGMGLVAAAADVTPVFSDGNQAAATVVERIAAATGTCHVAIYSMTEHRIFSALTNALSRGVDVRVVADMGQAKGASSLIPKLTAALTTNRVALATGRSGGKYGIMHNKFAVLDGHTVLTGSFNWTVNADRNNWENFVIILDPMLAHDFEAEFQKLWTVR